MPLAIAVAIAVGCSDSSEADKKDTGQWTSRDVAGDTAVTAEDTSSAEPDASTAADSITSAEDTGPDAEDTTADPDTGPTPDTGTQDTLTSDAGGSIFEGLWLVDQPAHALYEATLYNFKPSGTLVEVGSHALGNGPVPTGTVANCSGSGSQPPTSCKFGDKWRARDSDTVVVTGECSDNKPRDIALDFTGLTATSDPIKVEVADVDGQSGWCHSTFQWRWQRCQSKKCLPGD